MGPQEISVSFGGKVRAKAKLGRDWSVVRMPLQGVDLGRERHLWALRFSKSAPNGKALAEID